MSGALTMERGQDDYDFSDPFDAKKWAMHHDKICSMRWTSTDLQLRILVRGGLMAVTLAIALLGWSLKTNWDTQAAQLKVLQDAPQMAQRAADQASTQTALKLGATNSAATPSD